MGAEFRGTDSIATTDNGAGWTPAPLAADRPVVDGSKKSPGELRAEMERLLQESRNARERETVAELAARTGVNVDSAGQRTIPRQRHGSDPYRPVVPSQRVDSSASARDSAVTRVRQGVERVREAVPGRSTVRDAVSGKPGLIGGVVAVLLLALVVARQLLRR